MKNFTSPLKSRFEKIAKDLFANLQSGENLQLNLRAEKSTFLRFSQNKVRQNTDVEQASISLELHKNGKTVHVHSTLGANDSFQNLLDHCRKEVEILPEDPNQVNMKNHGNSDSEHAGKIPSSSEVIQAVVKVAEGSDLAGLFAGGVVVIANKNSLGQSHWFATESFSLDYSLYNGPKAAKSIYGGTEWNFSDWQKNFARTKEQLHLLEKPQVAVKPGTYRTYLAPGAVGEILSIMSWGAMSAGAWKRGDSPFKKFAEKEITFSPKFTLRENFGLGLCPKFNSLGEVAPETLVTIKEGKLENLLTSSRSAKEFGLTSNGSDGQEGFRSPEILPGSLKEEEILKELGTGLYLSNLHYLNWSDRDSARVTGMTRYACFWVENGKIQGPIKDLRFDVSLYDVFGKDLLALTEKSEVDPETSTYEHRAVGGKKMPGALIEGFTFTL
jgi:predicted Zn-dependent protease